MKSTKLNEVYRIFILAVAIISCSTSIMYFSYIYLNPNLGIWENTVEDLFISLFNLLMIVLPIVSIISSFLATRIIDLSDKETMKEVVDSYQCHFDETLALSYKTAEIQKDILARIEQYNESLNELVEKTNQVDDRTVVVQEHLDKLNEIEEKAKDIIQLLQTDNLLETLKACVITGTQDFQTFYNHVKGLKDSVENIFTKKTKDLITNYQELDKAVENSTKNAKFLDTKLTSIVTNKEIVEKVLS